MLINSLLGLADLSLCKISPPPFRLSFFGHQNVIGHFARNFSFFPSRALPIRSDGRQLIIAAFPSGLFTQYRPVWAEL